MAERLFAKWYAEDRAAGNPERTPRSLAEEAFIAALNVSALDKLTDKQLEEFRGNWANDYD